MFGNVMRAAHQEEKLRRFTIIATTIIFFVFETELYAREMESTYRQANTSIRLRPSRKPAR